jgi:hypothetical protein
VNVGEELLAEVNAAAARAGLARAVWVREVLEDVLSGLEHH